ncbi:MAG: AI-2E family transporter, partial [Bradyrhizobium sp.]|nr:AI-2E family transporter [Bradyrhizobium sp.]
MTVSADDRLRARNDLAWSISVGGIGIVVFAALLMFTWYFAATLFLIFAGMLLGVALNAMTHLLGRVVKLPHPLRLTLVCLVLAGMLSGVVFLGGATIARQATVLSDTIKSQLVTVKAFLEKNGIDTSYLELGHIGTPAATSTLGAPATPVAPLGQVPHNLPSAGAIASGGGAIV